MVSEFLWHVKRAKYIRFVHCKWSSITSTADPTIYTMSCAVLACTNMRQSITQPVMVMVAGSCHISSPRARVQFIFYVLLSVPSVRLRPSVCMLWVKRRCATTRQTISEIHFNSSAFFFSHSLHFVSNAFRRHTIVHRWHYIFDIRYMFVASACLCVCAWQKKPRGIRWIMH